MMLRLCVIGLKNCMKFLLNFCNFMIVMCMISVSVVLFVRMMLVKLWVWLN